MKSLNFLILILLATSIQAKVLELSDITSKNRVEVYQKAFDTASDRDNSIVFKYKQNKTFHINLREGTNTILSLPKKEIIQSYLLGDQKNVKFLPFKDGEQLNLGEIRPIKTGIDTNLTITGRSGNIYSFFLKSHSVHSKVLPHFVVKIVNDNLPSVRPLETTGDKRRDYLRNQTDIELTKINTRYKVLQKNSNLAPLEIFDDGSGWTYFRFSWDDNLDKVSFIPQIYRVYKNQDMLVNTFVKDGFIVAKAVSKKWTLRLDGDYACVRAY